MQALRDAIFQIVEAQQPVTVRQVYYRATVAALIDKTEREYSRVQKLLGVMRRDGTLPYEWISDNTRSCIQPTTYTSPQHAVRVLARWYRKGLWLNHGCRCQIWLEKDALSGVIESVTDEYDVPLMVCRGYPSMTFLHECAQDIADLDVPVFIYHLGDFDPSGCDASRAIEKDLREHAPDAEIIFERLAVTPMQIRNWNLPTRPTKTSDPRAAKFGAESVELDAIEPNELRALVRSAIERHLPRKRLDALKEIEERERCVLRDFVEVLQTGDDE
jgi:hypothetical protein